LFSTQVQTFKAFLQTLTRWDLFYHDSNTIATKSDKNNEDQPLIFERKYPEYTIGRNYFTYDIAYPQIVIHLSKFVSLIRRIFNADNNWHEQTPDLFLNLYNADAPECPKA
jgi:hypothetical protein